MVVGGMWRHRIGSFTPPFRTFAVVSGATAYFAQEWCGWDEFSAGNAESVAARQFHLAKEGNLRGILAQHRKVEHGALGMTAHERLLEASERSRKMQKSIRQTTFAPETTKTLRRFSSWEAAELIFGVNRSTFNRKHRANTGMPAGVQESESGGLKWFTVEELNQIRHAWTEKRGANPLLPNRPANKRALRVAVANFKGGAGKSTTALHFAHAAALDGYKVLVVDFDPQATISHAMGLIDVAEELTVWGIIARDLMRETKRMNLQRQVRGEDREKGLIPYPASISTSMIEELSRESFITETCWPTIDMIGSCANAAFVEFATAEYRMTNQAWSFFAAVDRYLDRLPDDRYDLIIFDCPPAIGYQSLNAVFAADVLYVPTGAGYWEYDSTTSFMAQLSESLAEMGGGFEANTALGAKLPKDFMAIKVILTRYEPTNELHKAMRAGLKRVFGDWVTEHPIELTRAVEQTGRFLQSVYEMDYRQMTRETWRRARRSFDAAYGEFKTTALDAWERLPESDPKAEPKKGTAA